MTQDAFVYKVKSFFSIIEVKRLLLFQKYQIFPEIYQKENLKT